MSAQERDPRWVVDWGVEAPRHMSVTLASKLDHCPRDAALYLRFRGQQSASQLLRGSFGHVVFERIMGTLIANGETSLFAPQPGEDVVKAAAEVSQMTKEWVDEIALELGWPLSEAEIDRVRQMAYHFAVGNAVDPSTVVALERSFVLELPGGGRLLGKVDLASLRTDGILQVDDYKTSIYVPPTDVVSEMLQVPLYAALLLWGRPYERVPCVVCDGRRVVPDGDRPYLEVGGGAAGKGSAVFVGPEKTCATCEGRGYVEKIGEPLGLDQFVTHVWCRQVYPQRMAGAEMEARTVQAPARAGEGASDLWTLPDLRDKIDAAARLYARLQVGVTERYWPAKSGEKHCQFCTARALCPIPAALRRHAGEILTVEQAAEAFEWAQQQKKLVRATENEVKAFMKTEDAPPRLQVGEDEYGFVTSSGTQLRQKGRRTDWDGLTEAIDAAANEGAPFAVEDWLEPTSSTSFKRLPKADEGAEAA